MTHTSTTPTPSTQRIVVSIPVVAVTLMEDRAKVTRRASLDLDPGHHRLRIEHVAPVLQDVSLQGDVVSDTHARVSDTTVRRELKALHVHQDEEWAQVQQDLERMEHDFEEAAGTQKRAQTQYVKISKMLFLSNQEVSQDVAWGVEDLEHWHTNLNALFERARDFRTRALDAHQTQLELKRRIKRLRKRLHQMASPSRTLAASIDLDVMVSEGGDVTIEVQYMCPNAMWRPQHRAVLQAQHVHVQTQAVVWQNTGEDWNAVELTCSTARASLGVDPPQLRADLIQAQRKQQEVQVMSREVEVQSTGPGGQEGAAPDTSVLLPGVDDGGQTRVLSPEGPVDILSTGDAHIFGLFDFKSDASLSLNMMPELDRRASLTCTAINTSDQPLLAGPVELVRDAGAMGWTTSLYVAPGAPFELSFGTQDDVRVQRYMRVLEDKVDTVSHWHNKRTRVQLFLSNLGGQERTILITERVPVSEIEHVVIKIDDVMTTSGMNMDEHGMCSWSITLKPRTQIQVMMEWTISSAPDVQGVA